MKMTGCLPKCNYASYKFEVEANEDVYWKTNWLSSFYLMPKSATVKHAVQKYEFGLPELTADFGSYLGLFLGCSLHTITRDIPAGLRWLQNFVTTSNNKHKPCVKEMVDNAP